MLFILTNTVSSIISKNDSTHTLYVFFMDGDVPIFGKKLCPEEIQGSNQLLLLCMWGFGSRYLFSKIYIRNLLLVELCFCSFNWDKSKLGRGSMIYEYTGFYWLIDWFIYYYCFFWGVGSGMEGAQFIWKQILVWTNHSHPIPTISTGL